MDTLIKKQDADEEGTDKNYQQSKISTGLNEYKSKVPKIDCTVFDTPKMTAVHNFLQPKLDDDFDSPRSFSS